MRARRNVYALTLMDGIPNLFIPVVVVDLVLSSD